jgi:hypothetical protein
MLFKNSVRTSKRTPHFTITKIQWLMLFKKITSVYFQNNAKPKNTINGQNAVIGHRRRYIYLPLGLKNVKLIKNYSNLRHKN